MTTAITAELYLADTRALSDARIDELMAWLGADELLRYRRFVRRERQRQFVAGRVLLRHALGRLLDVPARVLQFEEQIGKGPALLAPHKARGFSISHTGHWVAVAVSAGTALGLDIETLDPERDVLGLARQAFSAEQIAWLAARPEAGRVRDFYRMWSEHEARIKLNHENGYCIELPHAQISIALCSVQPLAGPVHIQPFSLAG
jgi:4'-phosphopantetheinyl transferase